MCGGSEARPGVRLSRASEPPESPRFRCPSRASAAQATRTRDAKGEPSREEGEKQGRPPAVSSRMPGLLRAARTTHGRGGRLGPQEAALSDRACFPSSGICLPLRDDPGGRDISTARSCLRPRLIIERRANTTTTTTTTGSSGARRPDDSRRSGPTTGPGKGGARSVHHITQRHPRKTSWDGRSSSQEVEKIVRKEIARWWTWSCRRRWRRRGSGRVVGSGGGFEKRCLPTDRHVRGRCGAPKS